MKFATWNLNSIASRLSQLEQWLAEESPDVVCLQETRVTDENFPYDDLETIGYHAVHHSGGGRAGVALLSRQPLANVSTQFVPPDPVSEARLIRGTLADITWVCVYVPTRVAIGKTEFLDMLRVDLSKPESGEMVVGGDFNLCASDLDTHSVAQLADADNFPNRPEDIAFRRLLGEANLADLFRLQHPERRDYSWFDYRFSAFKKRKGLRLDYLLGTRGISQRISDVWVDYSPRGLPKPSDHAPVVATLR